MEEILASIRQIISEDGEGADKAGTGQAEASGGAATSDPGEERAAAADADEEDTGARAKKGPDMDARAEADLAKAEEAFSSDGEASGDDGDSRDEEPMSESSDDPVGAVNEFAAEPDSDSDVEESISMAMSAQSQHQTPAPIGDENLLSEDSDQVVHGAFSALAHTILAQNARTLEDLVSEMLQPMLKGWLDDNLPSLVERLVKEEIDRVSRGRR
jgi:cell pole-organizing protein PopZ